MTRLSSLTARLHRTSHEAPASRAVLSVATGQGTVFVPTMVLIPPG